MGHISDRAEKFAQKFVKPKPPEDDRPIEIIMGDFYKKYNTSDMLREARAKKDKTHA